MYSIGASVKTAQMSGYLFVQPTNIEQTIRTPQELVHIKHTITIRQYKYWIIMVRLYREAHELGLTADADQYYRVKYTDLERYMGYVPKKSELRQDLEALRKEAIIYNVLTKDKKPIQRGTGFINEWEVTSSSFGFKLPTFLTDIVKSLDFNNRMFLQLNWDIFSSFSGKYEAIIWKLCKDYVGVPCTPEMSIASFREYCGLREGEYQEFKDLNKYIISGPVKRLNDNNLADILVEPVMKKEGRRVVSLYFRVQPKRQTVLDFGDDPAFRFARVQFPLADQKRYLSSLSAEEVELCVERANEYADELEKKGEPVNIGGLYRKAIEGNWGRDLAQRKALEEKQAAKKATAKKKEHGVERLESLRSDYEVAWREKANAAVAAMDEQALAAEYDAYLADKKPMPALVKKGLESESFRAWLRQKILPKPTEEEFLRWAEMA